MKAVVIENYGKADQLKLGDVPRPAPKADELLIKVEATALNRADIYQRQGRYSPPPGVTSILGLEMAGVIVESGKDCENWKTGDRVFGLLPGGGYAEYVSIHHKMAMPVPENLSMEEAAAVPETFFTAYQAMHWLGNLKKNETVLIHAGASGVGTAAIQIARDLGAKVIVTASSPEKISACRSLGAHAAIPYKEKPFDHAVLEFSRQKGVDLIIDFIGAPYWEPNLRVLKQDGRLVLLATLGGTFVQNFDLKTVLQKRVQIRGSTLRNRDLHYKINLTAEISKILLPKFAQGILHPVVDRIFDWKAVAEAHNHMESNANIGKIVLKITQ